MFVKDMWKKP